jgi:hypothetical protein
MPQGETAIKRWIDQQMDGTSVTVVLIGAETANRPWVQYEIKKSHERRNGLLGVYIHSVKNQAGNTDIKGRDPFVIIPKTPRTYDWVLDNGHRNLGDWVESAAREIGR